MRGREDPAVSCHVSCASRRPQGESSDSSDRELFVILDRLLPCHPKLVPIPHCWVILPAKAILETFGVRQEISSFTVTISNRGMSL
ncbi:Hypothetical predicted protein [Pelobates cultripes]|uniref:Uncharacterized protein n=1 Tax=Pelobates cultripes TaxID=61616 RepID=A0AAD1R4G4_PELCU|nr:Hypothetical predicted protein [Pelobates cultripes]